MLAPSAGGAGWQGACRAGVGRLSQPNTRPPVQRRWWSVARWSWRPWVKSAYTRTERP